MSIRLQGISFSDKKNNLKLISIQVSDKGNIRANVVDKNTQIKYHHWLNSQEKEKFVIANEEIYNKYLVF